MMEYIHDKIGANTLFSTHYHELTALEKELPRLQNVHVSATEKNGTVVFLHKVKKGAADQSYGIHVAQLAQLPAEILTRARVLLENFESGKVVAESQEEVAEQPMQMSLFAEAEPIAPAEAEVLKSLEKVNILGTSPMQAMNILYELQQQLLNAKK